VIGPSAAIVLPSISEQVEHEAELAVVIGQEARNLSPETAWQAVLGYTCANDVTARDLQRRDGQWSRAKGFDTFCPLGPWIESELDPASLDVTCSVNDVLRQKGTTSDMVFDIPLLLAYVSRIMTLEPGDLLLTGTPEGVGRLRKGDTVAVSITGIGTLTNPVKECD
jgi:2-keto-4-pentenoate hydratase/2-oxohepta-3-ene-1,7-dioic acid hydratase in catechol pathway